MYIVYAWKDNHILQKNNKKKKIGKGVLHYEEEVKTTHIYGTSYI